MIIQCPQCQSRFKLPKEKTKSGGTKVRCTKCKSIFFITPQGAPEKDVSGSGPQQNSDNDWTDFSNSDQEGSGSLESEKESTDFFGEDFDAAEFFAQGDADSDFFLNGEPAPESAIEEREEDFFPKDMDLPAENGAEPAKAEGPVNTKTREEFAGVHAGEEAVGGKPPLTLAEEEPPPPPVDISRDIKLAHIPPIPESLPPSARRKSSSAGPLLVVLFLLIAAAGGFLLYRQGMLPDYLQPWKKKQAELPVAIDLRPADLSGYHESNSVEGRLFVIQGRVDNHSAEARAGIQVLGSVYDRSGAVIARQAAYCGNPLSRPELRSLSYERMKERMNNQFGEVLSNINIEPKKSVSFMIVFKGVPEEVAEFGVEVLDSKPVAK